MEEETKTEETKHEEHTSDGDDKSAGMPVSSHLFLGNVSPDFWEGLA